MRRQGEKPVRPITQIKGYDALIEVVRDTSKDHYIVLGDVEIGGVNPVLYMSDNQVAWDWTLYSCNDPDDDKWYMVDGSKAIDGSDITELPCSTIAVSRASALAAIDDIRIALTDKGINLNDAQIEERVSEPGLEVISGLFTQS